MVRLIFVFCPSNTLTGGVFTPALFIGATLGWAVDKSLGTRPWGIVIGFFIGIVVGMYDVFRVMTNMNASTRQDGEKMRGSQQQGDWSDED